MPIGILQINRVFLYTRTFCTQNTITVTVPILFIEVQQNTFFNSDLLYLANTADSDNSWLVSRDRLIKVLVNQNEKIIRKTWFVLSLAGAYIDKISL